MKKLRAGIIGAGNMGALFDNPKSASILTHAHAYAVDDRFELVGFYDNDPVKLKVAAERWNCKAYFNLKDLLEQVDVVSCTVPDEYHYSVLLQILDSHVLLVFAEKPLTKESAQAGDIKKQYEKKGIPMLINYSRRFLPEFADLKKELKSYGKFLRGNGYYGKGICHNGSHLLDMLHFLFEKDVLESYEVLGGVTDCFPEDPSVDAILRFQDATFLLQAVDCRNVTLFELDLLFEKNRIKILDGGSRMEVYQVLPSKQYEGYYNYKLMKEVTIDYSNALLQALQNIASIILQNEEPLCGLEDGIEVLTVCEGMKKVYEKNFTVCERSRGGEHN